MEADAAKAIGAGIACLGMGLVALGLGNIFGNYLAGAMRNPSAAPQQSGNLFLGMALAEALGLFAFVISMLILFAA